MQNNLNLQKKLGKVASNFLRPQVGPQSDYFYSPTRITLAGGHGGGGKTFGTALILARYMDIVGYRGSCYRSAWKKITDPGQLFDSIKEITEAMGFIHTRGKGDCKIRNPQVDAEIGLMIPPPPEKLSDAQGLQSAVMILEEVTEFTREQFFFLFSRNRLGRELKGIDEKSLPIMRATCNPDYESWLREFLDWYIGENGFIIKERDKAIRYFFKKGDDVFWFDTKKEGIEFAEDSGWNYGRKTKREPISFQFIDCPLEANKILLGRDKNYRQGLESMDEYNARRLLGDWNVRRFVGKYFFEKDFTIRLTLPNVFIKIVRGWDFAATQRSETNTDPDYTASVCLGLASNGDIFILHAEEFQLNPSDTVSKFENTLMNDKEAYSQGVFQSIPTDPGAVGKLFSAILLRNFSDRGYIIGTTREEKNKEQKAFILSQQAGNPVFRFKVMKSNWNRMFFNRLTGYTGIADQGHDDIVDAFYRAYEMLVFKDSKEGKKIKDISQLIF